MTLPRYSEYKNSGVEWLRAIPSHWKVIRVKRLVSSIEQGWSPQCESFPAETVDEWGVLKVGCVNGGVFKPSENKKLPPELEPMPAYTLKRDDLLISRANTRELVGSAAVVLEDFENLMLCDKLYRLRVIDSACSATFLAAYLGTLETRSQIELEATGSSSSMLNIGQSVILELPVPLPDMPEQRAITTFLDHEIAKIDGLIAEQEKLIALLAEKRQATISHAVTRGLNPQAPVKDSGVPWLGEVPAHWEVAALKRFWSVTDCKHVTAEFVEDGFPLASIREVQARFVTLDGAKRTTQYFYEQLTEGGRRPQPGDLIFSRNAAVGEVAQVAEFHPEFAMGQDVCLLRRHSLSYSADFLQAVIRSRVVVEQLGNIMVGSTFKRVNVEDIRGLIVAMPPAAEQARIAEFVNNEAARLEQLIDTANRAIGLMQERRSALIAAAVTGQIDVRGTVAQATSAQKAAA